MHIEYVSTLIFAFYHCGKSIKYGVTGVRVCVFLRQANLASSLRL